MEHPFLFHICWEISAGQSQLDRWAPILLEITFNLAQRGRARARLFCDDQLVQLKIQ